MAEEYEEEEFEEEELEEPEAEPIEELNVAGASVFGTKERVGVDRISSPFLGWLARSALISKRVKMLEGGAPSTIALGRLKSGDIVKVAEQELEERVIPLKIVRRFPNGFFEVWYIGDFIGIAGIKKLL